MASLVRNDDEFDDLKYELGKHYKGEKYDMLKFCLLKILPQGDIKPNFIANDIFNALEEKGVISTDNVCLLLAIAKLLKLQKAVDLVSQYMTDHGIPNTNTQMLLPYRKRLFKALKEVREDTLDEIISRYKLRNVADNLPNIWAVVCYLERELHLEDKPDKIKRFAKLLPEQARNILLDNEKKHSLKRPLDRLGEENEESEGKETEPEEQVVQKRRKRKAKNSNKMAKMKDNEINEEQHGDSEGGGDEEQELSEMEEDEMEGVQVVQKRRNEKEKKQSLKRPLDRLGEENEESEGKETEPEEEVQAKNLNKMAKTKDNEIDGEQHEDSEGGGNEEQEHSEMEGVQVVQKRRNKKEKPEKAKPKKLRNYQIKLAKPVISGQNTIIISHTGSGKTVVAVHFVREHFKEQEAKLNVKPKKVIFLANTISLVSQQHDLFKEDMPESMRLTQLIGDNVQQLATMKNEVENNDIIFLTAQMLVNALEKNELKIDDFTMLVFDECHHCHGQNPYNIIMAKYRRRKLKDEAATLPQIVGLTANIGTGKASSQEKSDEYAKSIFANLDADEISIPDENDEEYHLNENPPEEIDPILVKPRSDDADPFKTEIMTIMSEIEKIMRKGVDKQGTMSDELADLFNFTKSVKGTSSYEQGVENFISHSPECVTSNDSLLRLLRTGGEHLRKYNDSLKENTICRIQDALRFIKKFIEKEESTRSDGLNEDDKQLIRLFKDREEKLQYVSGEKKFENPLLSKFEDVLIGEYKTNTEAHAIIFCTKRITVDAMYSWIKENERLSFLKPEKISSEMTPVDRDTVLKNFKENECNILVGTKIVEEGIDVPACNLVFRYNYMSSDVGRTQAKGRGRKKNSKFYMIASTEFNFEERDQENKIRNQFMTKSVRTLSKLPKDQLKEELLALQTIDLRERIMSEKKERDQQQKRTEAPYKLLCGKCSEFACYSTDVKVFNDSNHLIVDQEFYENKILTQKHPKPKVIGDDIYKNGKVSCKKCNHDWGVIVTISSMNFAVIKIVSFVLEKCADRMRKTVKKWKESPFKVEPLDINNFKQQNPDWSIDLDFKQ